MLTSTEIGIKIAEARKAKNLSQASLAQQLSLSPQAVGKWERGESLPDIITLDRLARTLGVDLNYFSEHSVSAETPSPAAAAPILSAAEPLSEPETKRRGWNMSQGSWVDADFSGLSGLNEKFGASLIRGCLFVGSDLSGLTMNGNHIEQCDFAEAKLDGSRLRGSHLSGSRFVGTSLLGASLTQSHLQECDLSAADCTDAKFHMSNLQKCTLANTVWSRTHFHIVQFSDVVLSGTFDDCAFEGCTFTRTTFRDAVLTRTFFKNKSLKKVKFENCRTDRLTYSFLKNNKADMSAIALIED